MSLQEKNVVVAYPGKNPEERHFTAESNIDIALLCMAVQINHQGDQDDNYSSQRTRTRRSITLCQRSQQHYPLLS